MTETTAVGGSAEDTRIQDKQGNDRIGLGHCGVQRQIVRQAQVAPNPPDGHGPL